MRTYGCLSVSVACSRFTYHTGGHTGFVFSFKREWAFFSKRIVDADRIGRALALITGVRGAVVSFENLRLSAIFTKANATEHGGRAGSAESENANDRL